MTEIRTAEELLALPEGTVVAWGERQQIGHIAPMGSGLVLWIHDGVWFDYGPALQHLAPLTVLYRPDLPTQAELHAAVERVRGLCDPDACPIPETDEDARGTAGWRFAMEHVLAALDPVERLRPMPDYPGARWPQ